MSAGDTCCGAEGDVGRDAERLVGGEVFAGGFLVDADDEAPLLVGAGDGAEMEGMKVEALVRGNLSGSEVATAGVSGCCLGWSTDWRPCRPAAPERAGVVATGLFGGTWCGSGTGAMAPSGGPGPCAFPRSGASEGPGPCPGAGPAARGLGPPSGARCWSAGSAEARDLAELLLLSRSVERKVGSLDELWFCRWVCGQADDAEVVDDSDDDDVNVETAVAVELFLDPSSMAEDLRACWAWFCPSVTPPDCSAAGIVARRAWVRPFVPFALAFVGVLPLN